MENDESASNSTEPIGTHAPNNKDDSNDIEDSNSLNTADGSRDQSSNASTTNLNTTTVHSVPHSNAGRADSGDSEIAATSSNPENVDSTHNSIRLIKNVAEDSHEIIIPEQSETFLVIEVNQNVVGIEINFRSTSTTPVHMNLANNLIKNFPDSITTVKLVTLICRENKLLASLPNNIGNIESLKKLDCSFCGLSNLPESISTLSNLEHLDCGRNPLRQLPKAIGELTNLKQLHCSATQLKSLPDSITSLTNLEFLDCSDNQLTELPNKIGNLTQLQVLYCNNNLITELPHDFGRLVNLKRFCSDFDYIGVIRGEIWNRMYTGSAMNHSGTCFTELSVLDLSGKSLRILLNFTPTNRYEKITTLKLNSNRFKTLPKDLFQWFPNLKVLEVQNNAMRALPDDWKSEKLQSLDCSVNHISNLNNLANQFPNLEILNLGYNENLDKIPLGLNKLQQLDISGLNNFVPMFKEFALENSNKCIESEIRKPLPKLCTKLAVCLLLLFLSVIVCVDTFPDVRLGDEPVLEPNCTTIVQLEKENTALLSSIPLSNICDPVCNVTVTDDNSTSIQQQLCMENCKIATLVQYRIEQLKSENATHEVCEEIEVEQTTWSTLAWFRVLGTLVACLTLLPDLFDAATMGWLFQETRFTGSLLEILTRGNIMVQVDKRLQNPYYFNMVGGFLAIFLIPFSVINAMCGQKSNKLVSHKYLRNFIPSPLYDRLNAVVDQKERTTKDWLALVTAMVDYVQTFTLFPLAIAVIMTSDSTADVLVNVVAVNVFAVLDDEIVRHVHHPQDEMLARWELYGGSEGDLANRGQLSIHPVAECTEEDRSMPSKEGRSMRSAPNDASQV